MRFSLFPDWGSSSKANPRVHDLFDFVSPVPLHSSTKVPVTVRFPIFFSCRVRGRYTYDGSVCTLMNIFFSHFPCIKPRHGRTLRYFLFDGKNSRIIIKYNIEFINLFEWISRIAFAYFRKPAGNCISKKKKKTSLIRCFSIWLSDDDLQSSPCCTIDDIDILVNWRTYRLFFLCIFNISSYEHCVFGTFFMFDMVYKNVSAAQCPFENVECILCIVSRGENRRT